MTACATLGQLELNWDKLRSSYNDVYYLSSL